ncbi:uncharacterized protein DNG_00953 [Cephalotrichum gorgonifer]|uniref:DUF7918 domain-containing protein n=1 Tax=Cephalotrichum gorgonifer TaxID=2041049 RepID=A0AAE8MQA5_9PEZI|nr:uncharacterized protein DNG_00953 [Cephalotrichum gorgonifer]
MPCFKGIAVSIHSNSAPIPEHGVQKQSRVSRINTYIPVPTPRIAEDSTPEPARFAISITLLTPSLAIPYSTPKPTDANPRPKPQYVGSLTGGNSKAGGVTPYIPMTNSPNETIAAYIYFDGRAKEEVATLLRPGEETWVNSRWVQVPESEGGGLAEREFLFKEVGLERWLNGLDLQADDAEAKAKIERRRKKFERRRRRQTRNEEIAAGEAKGSRDILRYGADDGSPVEALSDDSDSFSDDDEPPEATGQIKVAMFRVLASGEIKKGEYSPQFDAHDDDDELDAAAQDTGASIAADVEHTTSFAKPKTLDPSTISTQTVTGLDPPEKPYATFTFFYRGERQLQKIGVISKAGQQTPGAAKRRSVQLDFSNLGPLKTTGTVGFTAFRDAGGDGKRRRKDRAKSNGDAGTAMQEDSEDDDDDDGDILAKMDDADEKATTHLSPDDAGFTGELADGVDRMRLKRAHSADPGTASAGNNSPAPTGPSGGLEPSLLDRDATTTTAKSGPVASAVASSQAEDNSILGSPLKRHRPSVSGPSDRSAAASTVSALDSVLSRAGSTPPTKTTFTAGGTDPNEMEEEEEL